MKTTKQNSPLSGYAIVKVYQTSAQLKPVPPGEIKGDGEGASFSWDWRWGASVAAFEVRLTVSLEAAAERPYSATVDAVGRFRQVGDKPAVAIEEFVRLQAVAIVMPYLRQHLTNLTVNTLSGPYFLPSINIAELMKDFDPKKATGATEMVPAERSEKAGKRAKGRDRLASDEE